MKIRTITGFLHLKDLDDVKAIQSFSQKLSVIKKAVSGTSVQTVRISFQNLPELIDLSAGKRSVVAQCQELEKLCNDQGVSIINVGCLQGKYLTVENIEKLTVVIANTNFMFGSVLIDRWDEEIFRACAKVYKKLARAWPNGRANIKYATTFHLPPFSPFYPGAYQKGKGSAFTVGLEWGEELMAASKKAHTIPDLSRITSESLQKKVGQLENKLKSASARAGITYKGIDLSLATSLGKVSTLPAVWENMGMKFGDYGSLAITRAITEAIENVDVQKVGYSGLMIPVLEDFGLAKISKELSIEQLLHYSSVCGTGLDCVPLPGSISLFDLGAILKDVYALSDKWKKPLSARLFPIPGKKKGQRTNLRDQYLVEAYVME